MKPHRKNMHFVWNMRQFFNQGRGLMTALLFRREGGLDKWAR